MTEESCMNLPMPTIHAGSLPRLADVSRLLAWALHMSKDLEESETILFSFIRFLFLSDIVYLNNGGIRSKSWLLCRNVQGRWIIATLVITRSYLMEPERCSEPTVSLRMLVQCCLHL